MLPFLFLDLGFSGITEGQPARRRQIEELPPVQGQSGQSSESLASQGSIPRLRLNEIGGEKGHEATYKNYQGIQKKTNTEG